MTHPQELEMNAMTYEEEPLELPQRRRRRLLTGRSAVLFAVIIGGVCFYAGVRVEKGQLSSSSGATSGLGAGSGSGFAARLAGAGGASRPGAGAGAGAAAGRGAASGTGGASGGAGNGAFGTVSSVSHGALYVTDVSGNTVKVTLSSVTKVSKSLSVSRHAIRPGDGVVVLGARNAKGNLVATSVNDSGATGASSSGSTGSRSSSTSGGNAAVNSLFGSGGGG
jgi:hypothetical protein